MSKHKRRHSEGEAATTKDQAEQPPSRDAEASAGFAGPGYSGFGGSAGYHGSGVGGISGGYTGGSASDYSWVPPAETRHDDRIHDDVCDRLAMSSEIDASDIEVLVQAGSVTLEGNVETRHMKQIARDIAAAVPGVSSVHNRLHVEQSLIDELKQKLEPQHVPRHR
jgi:hypothetical protein